MNDEFFSNPVDFLIYSLCAFFGTTGFRCDSNRDFAMASRSLFRFFFTPGMEVVWSESNNFVLKQTLFFDINYILSKPLLGVLIFIHLWDGNKKCQKVGLAIEFRGYCLPFGWVIN